jgi:hypothetical protein
VRELVGGEQVAVEGVEADVAGDAGGGVAVVAGEHHDGPDIDGVKFVDEAIGAGAEGVGHDDDGGPGGGKIGVGLGGDEHGDLALFVQFVQALRGWHRGGVRG